MGIYFRYSKFKDSYVLQILFIVIIFIILLILNDKFLDISNSVFGKPQSINIGEILLINAFFSVDQITDIFKNIKSTKKVKNEKKDTKKVLIAY